MAEASSSSPSTESTENRKLYVNSIVMESNLKMTDCQICPNRVEVLNNPDLIQDCTESSTKEYLNVLTGTEHKEINKHKIENINREDQRVKLAETNEILQDNVDVKINSEINPQVGGAIVSLVNEEDEKEAIYPEVEEINKESLTQVDLTDCNIKHDEDNEIKGEICSVTVNKDSQFIGDETYKIENRTNITEDKFILKTETTENVKLRQCEIEPELSNLCPTESVSLEVNVKHILKTGFIGSDLNGTISKTECTITKSETEINYDRNEQIDVEGKTNIRGVCSDGENAPVDNKQQTDLVLCTVKNTAGESIKPNATGSLSGSVTLQVLKVTVKDDRSCSFDEDNMQVNQCCQTVNNKSEDSYKQRKECDTNVLKDGLIGGSNQREHLLREDTRTFEESEINNKDYLKSSTPYEREETVFCRGADLGNDSFYSNCPETAAIAESSEKGVASASCISVQSTTTENTVKVLKTYRCSAAGLFEFEANKENINSVTILSSSEIQHEKILKLNENKNNEVEESMSYEMESLKNDLINTTEPEHGHKLNVYSIPCSLVDENEMKNYKNGASSVNTIFQKSEVVKCEASNEETDSNCISNPNQNKNNEDKEIMFGQVETLCSDLVNTDVLQTQSKLNISQESINSIEFKANEEDRKEDTFGLNKTIHNDHKENTVCKMEISNNGFLETNTISDHPKWNINSIEFEANEKDRKEDTFCLNKTIHNDHKENTVCKMESTNNGFLETNTILDHPTRNINSIEFQANEEDRKEDTFGLNKTIRNDLKEDTICKMEISNNGFHPTQNINSIPFSFKQSTPINKDLTDTDSTADVFQGTELLEANKENLESLEIPTCCAYQKDRYFFMYDQNKIYVSKDSTFPRALSNDPINNEISRTDTISETSVDGVFKTDVHSGAFRGSELVELENNQGLRVENMSTVSGCGGNAGNFYVEQSENSDHKKGMFCIYKNDGSSISTTLKKSDIIKCEAPDEERDLTCMKNQCEDNSNLNRNTNNEDKEIMFCQEKTLINSTVPQTENNLEHYVQNINSIPCSTKQSIITTEHINSISSEALTSIVQKADTNNITEHKMQVIHHNLDQLKDFSIRNDNSKLENYVEMRNIEYKKENKSANNQNVTSTMDVLTKDLNDSVDNTILKIDSTKQSTESFKSDLLSCGLNKANIENTVKHDSIHPTYSFDSSTGQTESKVGMIPLVITESFGENVPSDTTIKQNQSDLHLSEIVSKSDTDNDKECILDEGITTVKCTDNCKISCRKECSKNVDKCGMNFKQTIHSCYSDDMRRKNVEGFEETSPIDEAKISTGNTNFNDISCVFRKDAATIDEQLVIDELRSRTDFNNLENYFLRSHSQETIIGDEGNLEKNQISKMGDKKDKGNVSIGKTNDSLKETKSIYEVLEDEFDGKVTLENKLFVSEIAEKNVADINESEKCNLKGRTLQEDQLRKKSVNEIVENLTLESRGFESHLREQLVQSSPSNKPNYENVLLFEQEQDLTEIKGKWLSLDSTDDSLCDTEVENAFRKYENLTKNASSQTDLCLIKEPCPSFVENNKKENVYCQTDGLLGERSLVNEDKQFFYHGLAVKRNLEYTEVDSVPEKKRNALSTPAFLPRRSGFNANKYIQNVNRIDEIIEGISEEEDEMEFEEQIVPGEKSGNVKGNTNVDHRVPLRIGLSRTSRPRPLHPFAKKPKTSGFEFNDVSK